MSGVLAEIYEEGREEGRDIGKQDVVLHMIQNTDLNDENIVQYTGLSLEKVQKLRQEANKEASHPKVC